MTFREAARRVLSQSRTPLPAAEIYSRALRGGLITSQGKTPVATLTAVLYADSNGPDPTFIRVAEPGPQRARRNTVRWVLANGRQAVERG